ncbi:hypothetical protein HETIRDRAFT_329536 [Heterobasidion irregulare TC 32-1]|uniref:Uncharacterized protein n=1 Tax=Heterobasidion irregulare (strain TC 32-1) TaxID=747525 RepID=W4JSM7_HETIT|nr:uncharacterized protein HETIRDRAFT_329536 [Heterobasidion irregulare TC 32-1]ETW75861.1 hypothetical protein HETIRDRAFT_329536 [Heterobasidion irregulare TC 32-1]
MIIEDDMVLGYLVDEVWLWRLAKKFGYIGTPNPAYLALYQEECHTRLMQCHEIRATIKLGRRIIEKVKIRGLRILPVYISNSQIGLCWSLPYSMHPEGRSAKKTAQLEFFKQVICEEDEPKWWASTNGDVPRAMQDVTEPREDYWRMTLQSLPGWIGSSEGFPRVEDAPVTRNERGIRIEPPPFIFIKKRDESDVETEKPSSPPPPTDDSEVDDCDMEDGEAED